LGWQDCVRVYQLVNRLGDFTDALKAYEGGHAPLFAEAFIEPLEVQTRLCPWPVLRRQTRMAMEPLWCTI
jgi:hypothetical protein